MTVSSAQDEGVVQPYRPLVSHHRVHLFLRALFRPLRCAYTARHNRLAESRGRGRHFFAEAFGGLGGEQQLALSSLEGRPARVPYRLGIVKSPQSQTALSARVVVMLAEDVD